MGCKSSNNKKNTTNPNGNTYNPNINNNCNHLQGYNYSKKDSSSTKENHSLCYTLNINQIGDINRYHEIKEFESQGY